MGSDQFIEMLSQVCSKLLPVVGVILLIILCIFFKNLITVLKNVNKAVEEGQKTVDITNEQLRKLDKPLNTVNNICDTVDTVSEAANSAVKSTAALVIDNLDKVKSKLSKKKDNEESEEIIINSEETPKKE